MAKRLRTTKIPVAGHVWPVLWCYPTSRCGAIEDGVSLELGDAKRPREGGWVIAYKDLLLLVDLAKRARQGP